MAKLENKLRGYGWGEDEIKNALKLMSPKKDTDLPVKTGNVLVYWIGLIIAIVANFLVALGIVPMLWILDDFWAGVMILVVGLCIGLFIDWILRDIEAIDPRHHIIAGLFLPCLAIIVMYVVVQLSNKAALITGSSLFMEHNAILIPALYMIAFMAPYLLTLRKKLGESVR